MNTNILNYRPYITSFNVFAHAAHNVSMVRFFHTNTHKQILHQNILQTSLLIMSFMFTNNKTNIYIEKCCNSLIYFKLITYVSKVLKCQRVKISELCKNITVLVILVASLHKNKTKNTHSFNHIITYIHFIDDFIYD